MHSLSKAAVVSGCLVLAVLFLAPPTTQGDEWNLATRFTVNHAFEVPRMVLQPNTPYVIRLLDSPSNRNVVQIYNSDQTQMLTMFMAISDYRMEPKDKTVFTFIETQPGFPLPMKEWFYPGRNTGLEFVYPKQQALEIARHAREPVLATGSTNLHDLASVSVESIGPITTQTSTTQTAAVTRSESTVTQQQPSVAEAPAPAEPAKPAEQEQAAVQEQQPQEPEKENVEIAQNEQQPDIQQENPVTEQAPAPSAEERTELPRTSGETALIALLGVLCLGAGLGVKAFSAKS